MGFLNSLLKSQSGSLLGLDIASSSVTLVELSQDKSGKYTLEHCETEPLPSLSVVEGSVEDFDEVVRIVRRVYKNSGSKSKKVAMALPASSVITKKLVLPSGLSDYEIDAQVEAEAHQYIPFALEEASLDYSISTEEINSSGDVEVLIAATREEKVREYQGIADAAGLSATILDIDSFASRAALTRLVEMLPNSGQGIIVALFEIGNSTSQLQIVRDGKVLYEREQNFGVYQLEKAMAQEYGFSADEAQTRRRNSDYPDGYEAAVLRPQVEMMASEINRALQFFFTSTPYSAVDYVMLSGDVAALTNLSSVVTSETGFACSLVNPFEGMHIAPAVKEKKLRRDAPACLTACGLAMRRIPK